MKKLFILLSFCCVFNSAIAIQPVEVIEQHIKEQKIDLAFTELQEVLVKYPDSQQANCYASSIAKFKGVDHSVYSSKCGDFMQKVSENESKLFKQKMTYVAICILSLGVVIAGFIFGTIGYKKHQKEQKEKENQKAKEDDKENIRKGFLRELIICKETLDNSLLLINSSSVNKLRKNKLKQKAEALLNLMIDGIEIVQENGDYDHNSLTSYITDIGEFNRELTLELEKTKNEA